MKSTVTNKECKKCQRGYLVEEVSSGGKKSYFCNNCFMYADNPKKPAVSEAEPKKGSLSDLTDEEIGKLLDGICIF